VSRHDWSNRVTRPHDDAWSLTAYTDRAGKTFLRVLPDATARLCDRDILLSGVTRYRCTDALATIAAQADGKRSADSYDGTRTADAVTLHPVPMSRVSMHGHHILTRTRNTTDAELRLERRQEDASLWST
jgi:hypothetical protein